MVENRLRLSSFYFIRMELILIFKFKFSYLITLNVTCTIHNHEILTAQATPRRFI